MKVFRYKNFDFEKGRLPKGFEWKTPEVVSLESPDSDYEEYTNLDYKIKLGAEGYKQNKTLGQDYVDNIASTLSTYAQEGIITVSEANQYGLDYNSVSSELNKGFWHSAYGELLKITPPQNLLSLHNDIKDYIKSHVNSYYPQAFHIS